METLEKDLENNLQTLKKRLPAEDILTYSFSASSGAKFAIVYADGVVNKEFLGELAARPLTRLTAEKPTVEEVKSTLLFPELKEERDLEKIIAEILDGNSALLIDGEDVCVIVGAKSPPTRAVVEPPTSVTVKGPREGFVEDVKINMGLLRKRLKTPKLLFKMLKAGKQSESNIAICYVDGSARKEVVEAI